MNERTDPFKLLFDEKLCCPKCQKPADERYYGTIQGSNQQIHCICNTTGDCYGHTWIARLNPAETCIYEGREEPVYEFRTWLNQPEVQLQLLQGGE